jgi:hypothetical protein
MSIPSRKAPEGRAFRRAKWPAFLIEPYFNRSTVSLFQPYYQGDARIVQVTPMGSFSSAH